MPRYTDRTPRPTPKYRKHRPSGQAVVTLNRRDHYLGPYGTKASKLEYDRLIAEWLANGRHPLPQQADDLSLTISQLIAGYWAFAKTYYVKDGKPTGSIPVLRVALHRLRRSYGKTPAEEFGPLALEALRDTMVHDGLSRPTVNELVAWIRRAFRWGVAKQLVPAEILQALAALPGLRKGRTPAREPEPVGPVSDQVVEATLPFLPPVVADMVRFQRLTGCRPGEVCILRPCDLDTSGPVWQYRPASHKTEHHGRERVVFIGPRAQDLLKPYLLREPTSYCFVPAESVRRRRAQRHENRRSPVSPAEARRRPKENPKRAPGNRYLSRISHRPYRKRLPSVA